MEGGGGGRGQGAARETRDLTTHSQEPDFQLPAWTLGSQSLRSFSWYFRMRSHAVIEQNAISVSLTKIRRCLCGYVCVRMYECLRDACVCVCHGSNTVMENDMNANRGVFCLPSYTLGVGWFGCSQKCSHLKLLPHRPTRKWAEHFLSKTHANYI